MLIKCWKSFCGEQKDKIYGLLGLARDCDGNIYSDYKRSLLQLYEAVLLERGLCRDGQLIWFRAFIQQLGEVPRRRKLPIECRNPLVDVFEHEKILMTQARQWQALYYDRVLTHEPVENISVAVNNALECMGHNRGRVINIDSTFCYVCKVPWDKSNTCHSNDAQYSDLVIGDHSEECEKCDEPLQRKIKEIELEMMGEQNGGFSQRGQISRDSCEPVLEFEPEQPFREEGAETPTAASNSAQSLHSLKPRWMMSSRGQIGLVPHNAKEGDLIYHFQDSDVAAIIRRHGPHSSYDSLVGSALILRRWDEDGVPMYGDSEEFCPYSVGKRGNGGGMNNIMEFHLDLESLKLLTSQPTF
ncbi:hypothetical protein B0J14DRAFT_662040 [Halenospora varia]|nr:hypothetical protein B0J14DRAFT_662040 [Halenospora varia]